MNVISEVKSIEKDIINWRRELHQIPEYSFDLYKTSRFVQDKLKKFNIEYRIAANTGVIATIYGSRPGKTVAVRADMDALPIKEETNLPFSSKNDFMHACGHDAHSAILLGAAKILSEHKDEINGNVRLIFQPAEETTGGAKIMIDEGCLENPKVDCIIGLHIGSLVKEGRNCKIGIKKGSLMASVDSFSVKIRGNGGHGALPHMCVDPIVASAEIITSLQRIISRELNPLHGGVITVGMISGGTDFNIIPEEVMFKGTIRLLDKDDRDFVGKRVKEIISETARAGRTTADIDYNQYYPAVVNNDFITDKLGESAKDIVGYQNVVSINEAALTAEDVSYYLNEVPGTFFILGSSKRNEDGNFYPHHHPKFDIDESVLWIGTATFLQFIKDYLK